MMGALGLRAIPEQQQQHNQFITMEYTEITMKVPKGYETIVKEFAMRKVESIINEQMMKPNEQVRNAARQEVERARDRNAINRHP